MDEKPSLTSGGRTLSTREMVAYGLPRSGSAMMFVMVAIYLSKFYTDTLLLAPAFVAWTFLIGRLWDGLTDPVMGYLSDATRTRMGRRRPYFLLSALPVAIAYFYLWSPSETLADWGLFVHLTLAYLATYTFYTVFSIPHNSLGAELTKDYHERSLLTGVREGLGLLGILVGTLLPPVFAARLGGEARGFSYLAGTVGAVTAVFILICFFSLKEKPGSRTQTPISIRKGLIALYRNRPFRTLVVAFVVVLIGNAFVPILVLYMSEYVVGMPEMAPYVIFTYIVTAAIAIPFWLRLSRRIGKKETWSRALVLASVAFGVGTYIHEGTWELWLLMAVFGGFGYGCSMALAPSMMADVIDLDELETGRRREGAYFGIWSFVDKSALGLAVFVGMYAIDLMGYVPNQAQSFRVIWTLKTLYFILPAVCFATGSYLLRRYPIDQREHERIRAAIEAKASSTTG